LLVYKGVFVTLRTTFTCTYLWYECKVCENWSFGFQRFLVLNGFDVVCV
jgi:hypothetical protein